MKWPLVGASGKVTITDVIIFSETDESFAPMHFKVCEHVGCTRMATRISIFFDEDGSSEERDVCEEHA